MIPLKRVLNMLPAKAPKVQDGPSKAQPMPEVPFPRNLSGLTVMMLVIVPLVLKALQAASALAAMGYGLILLMLAAGVAALFMGLKAQAADQDTQPAPAPRLPYKTAGAGALGLAAAVLTLLEGGNIVQAIAVLLTVPLLTLAAFGRDPRISKAGNSATAPRDEDLGGLTAQVASLMARVRHAAAAHADADVMPRMRLFDDAVTALLTAAVRDPERVDGLRKYFGPYLEGAVVASERFASHCAETDVDTGDPAAKQKYLRLLEKLAKAFSAKAHEYAKAGRTTLDAQMGVLETTLAPDAPRPA